MNGIRVLVGDGYGCVTSSASMKNVKPIGSTVALRSLRDIVATADRDAELLGRIEDLAGGLCLGPGLVEVRLAEAGDRRSNVLLVVDRKFSFAVFVDPRELAVT